ncbi:VOC family protein [Nonomuraea sp. NPDC046802]|uniref:VOC family protein n=1 Tax=Nonomuraea sp. NPDC046802 TaxID=3154919 RepID=UPI0033CE7509
MKGFAEFRSVVLDCPDPKRLADFYAKLLGWPSEEGSFRVFLGPAGHPFCLRVG